MVLARLTRLAPLLLVLTIVICPVPSRAEVRSPSEPRAFRGSCGAESLWALARKLGIDVSRADAVARLGPAGTDNSMLDVRNAAAASCGVALEGERWTYARLRDHQGPVIAHMKWGHFVVVTDARADQVTIIDGFDSGVVPSADTFRRQWSGFVLVPQSGGWLRPLGLAVVSAGVTWVVLSAAGGISRTGRPGTQGSLRGEAAAGPYSQMGPTVVPASFPPAPAT